MMYMSVCESCAQSNDKTPLLLKYNLKIYHYSELTFILKSSTCGAIVDPTLLSHDQHVIDTSRIESLASQ